jgi:hypothetical protein
MPRVLPDLIKAYELFTSKSDSPQVFHIWIALGTIAGAAQRKIQMRAQYFDVHTNLYIILTSPPGRAKKGAALRTGKNFLKVVEPKVNFATESASPEAVVKLMSKISNPVHQSMTIYSMELGTLMSTRPGEMVDFLTDIYDGNPDWERQTMMHDRQTITKPWLNIMAGTTPKWLGDKLGLIALEGGLVARCVFPYSDDRLLNNPWPRKSEEFAALGEAISADLSHIATLEGEFDFDGGLGGEAYLFYDAWYRDDEKLYVDTIKKLDPQIRSKFEITLRFQHRFPKMEDPRTASYYDRKHIHLLKVAMALSLSYKDDLVLTTEDLLRAKILLDATEPGMHKALGAAGKNPLATEILRIGAQIANKTEVTYRDLIVSNYHDISRKDLDIALESLRLMGRIKQEGSLYKWIGG